MWRDEDPVAVRPLHGPAVAFFARGRLVLVAAVVAALRGEAERPWAALARASLDHREFRAAEPA